VVAGKTFVSSYASYGLLYQRVLRGGYLMDEFRAGLGDAWSNIAEFLPKLVGFLLILIIGYFIAKAITKVLGKVLERVGFDRAVQRGGVGKALERSKYDASSLLAQVVFYALMLFVLQLAFGVFGPNPVSNLIHGVIAYLPNVFVAIVIIVVGGAVAAAVKEIVEASIGGLSYGRGLAFGAATAILVIAIFGALDQLNVAPAIVTGLFYALLAIIVGSAVEAGNIRTEARGSGDRIRARAESRMGEVRGETTRAGERESAAPASVDLRDPDPAVRRGRA
jgi:hypothetical protein